ncbi:MAG TPA: hypothetical protein VEZ40_20195 [Pyrinomonadaceae bacterium]|nr:hypothetical protein [Pyrinomonadaceae bacterium]
MKYLTRYSLLLILFLSCPTLTSAQGFKVESRNSPPPSSLKSSETFTSLEGRFTIALAQQISGFRGISFDTPKGKVTAGDSYSWKLDGAQFEVSYIDKNKTPNAAADGKEFLRIISEGVVAQAGSKNGTVLNNTDITLSGNPGREIRIEFPQFFVINRVYAVGDRIYQITAVHKKEPKLTESTNEILESFKVLTPADVEAAMKQKVAAAMPSPLPQEPIAKRLKSDAEDEGLKGKVKTVFTESEDLSGTWSVQARKPASMDYYNEQGNLTKRESYDYKGNPSDITVYGYLDGDRVSDIGSIQREYNPPPMMIASTPGETKPKYDSRYSYKFKFKYDDNGRLIEKAWHMNNGEPWLRYVYHYRGNQKEKLVYSANGSLNQKYLYTLDDKGNEIAEVIYEPKDNSVRSKYIFSYEFDSKGNWTKRVSSKWGNKDGQEGYQPYSVYYRTIKYY